MISADLLLKGLGGIAVVGGAAGVGVCYHQEKWIFAKEKEEDHLKTLPGKIGLTCTVSAGKTPETGLECTKTGTGEIKVKHDSTEFNVSAISSTSKIKVYKLTGEEAKNYNKGLKFVIEDGDIAGATGSSKKLEQFETYEIKEDAGKHYLTRKSESKDEIKKALGLPGTGCDMPTNTTETTCTLDEGKLKAINFEGKSTTGLNLETVANPTASLQMKIATADEKAIFPHGYKFTLISNRDITLDTSKVIKKGTNTEFKIKVTPATGGPKVLTLEKAWTVTALGEKVGLTCPAGQTKDCTLGTNIKVFNDDSSKTDAGTKPSTDGDSKKVTFEEGVENYNQGFKFTTTSDIQVSNGTGTEVKILANSGGNGVTYEIGTKPDGNNTKWYLIKKTNSGS